MRIVIQGLHYSRSFWRRCSLCVGYTAGRYTRGCVFHCAFCVHHPIHRIYVYNLSSKEMPELPGMLSFRNSSNAGQSPALKGSSCAPQGTPPYGANSSVGASFWISNVLSPRLPHKRCPTLHVPYVTCVRGGASAGDPVLVLLWYDDGRGRRGGGGRVMSPAARMGRGQN